MGKQITIRVPTGWQLVWTILVALGIGELLWAVFLPSISLNVTFHNPSSMPLTVWISEVETGRSHSVRIPAGESKRCHYYTGEDSESYAASHFFMLVADDGGQIWRLEQLRGKDIKYSSTIALPSKPEFTPSNSPTTEVRP
jgi:hypothetical protein